MVGTEGRLENPAVKKNHGGARALAIALARASFSVCHPPLSNIGASRWVQKWSL